MSDEEDCDCPPEGAPAWMATFSDMATLMLCFFVLLLSFANMDVQNFRTALGSVKEAFGVQFKVRGTFQAMSTSPVELSTTPSSDTLYKSEVMNREALAIVEEFVRSRGLESSLEVDSGEHGIIIRVKDAVLFDSGRARLKDAGLPTLSVLVELFGAFAGTMAIQGHTDNRPIRTAQFPSNWELSAARAAAVLRFMIEEGLNSDLVHIAGYADMRPIAPNSTPDGRNANRRVEFVFEHGERFSKDPGAAYDVNGLRIDDDGLKRQAFERLSKLAESSTAVPPSAQRAEDKDRLLMPVRWDASVEDAGAEEDSSSP